MGDSDTVSTGSTSSRNTNIRGRLWAYTWNNFTEDEKLGMEAWLRAEAQEWKHQPEKGKEGTIHLQGFMYFKNSRSFQALKKLWPKIHLEKGKNINALRNYCCKEDTKVGETVGEGGPRVLEDPMKGHKLYEWQEDLLKIIDKKPDPRKVYWLWEEHGGTGKTSFCKHLCIKYPRKVILVGGKAADMKYGIAEFISKPENDLQIVLINLVRSNEQFVSYEGIEAIKDGLYYNTKYKSGMCVFNPPHIFIFANFKPDEKKLSADRWEIWDIDMSPNEF